MTSSSLISAALLCLSLVSLSSSESIVVDFDGAPVFTVSPSFVSFTMDASTTAHWSTKRSSYWYNATVRSLAKHLAPAFFRFGGTAQDYTEYDFSTSGGGSAVAAVDIGPVDIGPVDIGPGPPAPPQHHQTLNSTEFDALVDFAKAANWDLIFGASTRRSRIHTTGVVVVRRSGRSLQRSRCGPTAHGRHLDGLQVGSRRTGGTPPQEPTETGSPSPSPWRSCEAFSLALSLSLSLSICRCFCFCLLSLPPPLLLSLTHTDGPQVRAEQRRLNNSRAKEEAE